MTSVTTAIESRSYIASAADIEKLAGEILDSAAASEAGRGTFLKATVATTQHELGAATRKRHGNTHAKLSEAEQTEHLAAFEVIYSRFYEAVVKVAENTVPDPDAKLMRSRTAFARSAGATVRSYIRAGHDIRVLAASKVTKAALAVPRARRKFTIEALQRRAQKLTEELEKVVRNLHAANSQIARETMTATLGKVVQAGGMAQHSTKDAEVAVRDHLPLQTRTGVLIPVDISVWQNRGRAPARKAA